MDMEEEDASDSAPPFQRFPYFGEHKRAVSAVALAPSNICESPVCASASADGTVKLWDVYAKDTTTISSISMSISTSTSTTNTTSSCTNQEKSQQYELSPVATLVGHSRGINDVAWSPQAPCLATASDDKTLRLWDAQTAEALVEFRGHSNFVFCVKFNPQSNLLISGSFDETVKLWDVRTGDCVSTIPAHSDPVTGVDLNRDGTCLVSGSHDGLLRIWDTATGECLKTIFAQANPPVSMVKYSPNGKYILSGTLDGKLRLWKTSKCCKTYASHVNSKFCLASDFLVSNPHRQAIVTGSENGEIFIYDLNSQQPMQILKNAHSDAVLALSCHDSSELIASGGMTADRTVQFWAPQVPTMDLTKKRKVVPDDSAS